MDGKKIPVIFNTGEVTFVPSIESFHRSGNSAFADGYDMYKESVEVNAINLKTKRTDAELMRLKEYEERYKLLMSRIGFKLKMTKKKREKYKLDDFEVIVKDVEAPSLPRFSALESSGQDTIELHTREAGRLFIGLPRNESSKGVGFPGMKATSNSFRTMFLRTHDDNPYVDFSLIQSEMDLNNLHRMIKQENANLVNRLKNNAKDGLNVNILENKQPIKFTVSFKNPYGFLLSRLLLDFDRFARLVYTLENCSVFSQIDSKYRLQNMRKEVVGFYNKVFDRKHTILHESIESIRRSDWLSEDIKPERKANLEQVVSVMGTVPTEVLICEIEPKHTRRRKYSYTSDVVEQLKSQNNKYLGIVEESDVWK
ncbi:AcaB family transcriptional regulator [Hydromonas duriensis]|uniref:Integrating conjugative element protein (TIGR03761 family) n=1 Tax=Hydromonas duriensis TaxID=1527608 RepID=A0A4R6Y0U4_9BURK|nr:AcaB family transcriptional regulator [Hydromonas duriensis]TDR28962.1 integrating conjugative element protein (TIGR03761 family) [Hydromonas duriensis]